jgi:hypothetical protein
LKSDRAQNEIVSVVVVLHQSGLPQMMHGRFFVTRLYPVMLAIPSDFHANRLFIYLME